MLKMESHDIIDINIPSIYNTAASPVCNWVLRLMIARLTGFNGREDARWWQCSLGDTDFDE